MSSHFTRWLPSVDLVYFVARFGPFCGVDWYPFNGENWYTLSYHLHQVFKLSMVLDTNKFDRIFSNHNLLETDGEEYIDPSLAHKGITILYRNSQYKKKVSLIVNSAVILKGKEMDAHKLIHKLQKRISEYFCSRYSLEDFALAELVLAADINVGDQDTVNAYIRVIQRIGKVKGFSPACYEDFDEDSSFCLAGNSNGSSFFLYDLRAAMANGFNGKLVPKDRNTVLRDAKGILRTEVRLRTPKAICAYSDKCNTSGQIIDLLGRDTEIFMSVFAQIVPYGDFYKKKDADDIVRQRVNDLPLRRKMLRLLGLVPEKKSLLLAQKAMNYREPNKLLIAFADIGVSPVTISKRADAKHLPSLYSYMDDIH